MTAYAAIPDSDLDADSPVTVSLTTAFRDNPIAIAEGASGAPRMLGANLVELSVADASASASIDFTGIDDTYDAILFVLTDIRPATNGAHLRMRVGTGAGPSWQTTTYFYHLSASDSSSALYVGGAGSSVAHIAINNAQGNVVNRTHSGKVMLFGAGDSVSYKKIIGVGSHTTSAGDAAQASVSGSWAGGTDPITAIRFMYSTGNITSGRIAMYGVKNV